MLRIALTALTALTLCAPAFGATIRISVAASLTDVVSELMSRFESGYPGARFIPNFGSSGTLAKQISQGAPADIFISANPKWMEHLAREELIIPASLHVLALNRMVLIGSKRHATEDLTGLLDFERIAIGNPANVPAGMYSRQALEKAGIYRRLQQQRKLVLAKDVRQALLYAEMGEVDGALVYRTDGLLAKNTRILFTLPAGLHDQVEIPVAMTSSGRDNEAVRAFYGYLVSESGAKVLARYGFDPQLRIRNEEKRIDTDVPPVPR